MKYHVMGYVNGAVMTGRGETSGNPITLFGAISRIEYLQRLAKNKVDDDIGDSDSDNGGDIERQTGRNMYKPIGVSIGESDSETLDSTKTQLSASIGINTSTIDGNPERILHFSNQDTVAPISCGTQKMITEQTCKMYQRLIESGTFTPSVSILAVGAPGAGKSVLGKLCAFHLKSLGLNPTLILKYNPTLPGHSLIDLYTEVGCSKNKPMIIVINEFDTILSNAVDSTIHKNPKFSQEVTDKQSLANFLDATEKMAYTIFIYTANSPLSFFESADRAFATRAGRINYKFTLNHYTSAECIELSMIFARRIKAAIDEEQFRSAINGKVFTVAQISSIFKLSLGDHENILQRIANEPSAV
jgi:hypothetical protein